MSEKGTMIINLKNKTKLFMDYDKVLHDHILRACNMRREGDSITLYGEGWPMEVEFLLSELYSIKVKEVNNLQSYAGEVEA